MYKHIIFILVVMPLSALSFQNEHPPLKELINFMVGGSWVSINANNSGEPEDYKSYFINFEVWHDDNSVRGSIYWITNKSDTTGLMEVWNFIDAANKNIRLIQRTTWHVLSEGIITPYKGKHLDIRFKSTTEEGQIYFTRDIHFVESPNKLRVETYHRKTEQEEWQKADESTWVRTERFGYQKNSNR